MGRRWHKDGVGRNRPHAGAGSCLGLKFDVARKHEADAYVGLSSESGRRFGAAIESEISHIRKFANHDRVLFEITIPGPPRIGYTPVLSEGAQRRLAAIVSADVAGYSRLIGQDEAGTLAALKADRAELIDPLIADHGGRIVKVMGDGLLPEFPSVVGAVKCQIEIQEGMAARNSAVPEDRRLAFRVGIHLGDIAIDGEDIHGDGVNIAARLQEAGNPGGIMLSGVAYESLGSLIDACFEDGGQRSFKNIARPVHVWRWASAQAEASANAGAAKTL